MTLYGYARVSVREPEDKNLDLQVERLVRAGCSWEISEPRKPAGPGTTAAAFWNCWTWWSRRTPCRPHDPNFAKALCLYLNSTPGVLTLLGGRDNRKPSYPSFSLDTLRSLPVPDFRAVDSERMTLLGRAFDQLQDKTLQPFPQMDVDPGRQQIDDVVAQILGLDPEWVDRVRRELTREPSVTDARQAD